MQVAWLPRVTVVAILIVVGSMTTGCSNDGEVVGSPGDGEPRFVTPVPDAADLATPPVEERRQQTGRGRPLAPGSLQQRTRGAALDFASYAVEVLNYSTATGDVEPLDDISFSGCEGCTGVIEDVRVIYAQGGWSEGGDWRLLSSAAVSDGRYSWSVGLRVHAQRQRVKRSRDSTVEFLPGGRRTVDMSVSRTDDGWLLTSLTVS